MAQFIGRTNLLTGRVLEVSPAGIELEVAGQRLRLSDHELRPAQGQLVRLVIRPEAIALHTPGPANGLAGTILSRTFLGEKVEYQVQIAGEVLQATSYNPEYVFAPGQPVAVQLPARGIPLLAGGAT